MASLLRSLIPLLARPMYRGAKKLFRKRRGRRAGRRVKKTKNHVHSFVRWCDKDSQYPGSSGPNVIVASNSAQNFVYTFKLDNVINPTDFTNLYDSYKINKVTLYLERQFHQTGTNNTVPYNRKISVVWDDDSNALVNEDDYLEYASCRRYNTIGPGSVALTLYPKILNKVTNAGASDAFTTQSSKSQWLKIEDDDVPHFGLKIHVPTGINTADYALFFVRAKFHISLKNSK